MMKENLQIRRNLNSQIQAVIYYKIKYNNRDKDSKVGIFIN